jgi:hypothetical protein
LTPDLVTGVNGKKVAIYVLNQNEFMHDTMQADGRTAHFMRLNSTGRHTSRATNVGLPLDSVVDYDLNNFQLKLREDFNLMEKIGESSLVKAQNPAIKNFASFSRKLAETNADAVHTGLTDSNMESFLSQLLNFFESKESVEHLHEPEQRFSALEQLTFELLKLKLIHDTKLTSHQKIMIDQCAISEVDSSFEKLVDEIRLGLIASKEDIALPKSGINKLFNFRWSGVRQKVELPQNKPKSEQGVKKIEPEMLSQKFLKSPEYH